MPVPARVAWSARRHVAEPRSFNRLASAGPRGCPWCGSPEAAPGLGRPRLRRRRAWAVLDPPVQARDPTGDGGGTPTHALSRSAVLGARAASARKGRIGRGVTMISGRVAADRGGHRVGHRFPEWWCRTLPARRHRRPPVGRKMPAWVTNPGMTAEKPTPLPAYSQRSLAVAPARPIWPPRRARRQEVRPYWPGSTWPALRASMPGSSRWISISGASRSRARTLCSSSGVPGERGRRLDPGVVHQDVERAEVLLDCAGQALRRVGPGEVGGERPHRGSEAMQVAGQVLGRGPGAGGDRHVHSGPGEVASDVAAQAAGGSGQSGRHAGTAARDRGPLAASARRANPSGPGRARRAGAGRGHSVALGCPPRRGSDSRLRTTSPTHTQG